jgi:tetratricopeptide (TPR) repeat protein
MPYAAAAAILAVAVLCWFMFIKPVTPQQMARQYEQQQFASLDVTMSSREDSLQHGLHLYNEGKPGQALQQFESMISKNDSDFTAKKYAGIVSLELREYDKALDYFRQIQQYKGLYSNPGKFLYALTLMKRSMPGDLAEAKQLLQQVAQSNDLEGKETAQQWLSKW